MSTKGTTAAIIVALVAWGIYLAIGATGMFVQESMMDARKSFIVLVCVCLFLTLWGLVIRRQRQSLAPASASPTTETSWNRSALATLALGIAAIVGWSISIFTWESVSPAMTTTLGWLTALAVLASATAGMIALSDRSPRKGKWLGLLGLFGFALALIGFVARMTP